MKPVLLATYIARQLFITTAAVMTLLLVLFSFLNLTEALEDVGRGSFGTSDALAVVLLTIPALVVELLPVAALLGSILGLGALANHYELVAIRAAGTSKRTLISILLIISILIAGATVFAQTCVVPLAETQAQEFRARALTQTERGGDEFWSRDQNRILRIGGIDYGRIPTAIEIFELSGDGRLQRLITAESAEIALHPKWRLLQAKESEISGEKLTYKESRILEWHSFLSPEQLQTLVAPIDTLSTVDLYHYLRSTADSGVDNMAMEGIYWRKMSVPVSVIAMTLLALPIVLGGAQPRSTGFRIVIGGAIGITFYLLQQVSGQSTELFNVAPALAAFAPPIAILLVALIATSRQT
ncbi:MAG: LPS export ABC transporter permease LptG [Gammaproteobacteria bacterium]